MRQRSQNGKTHTSSQYVDKCIQNADNYRIPVNVVMKLIVTSYHHNVPICNSQREKRLFCGFIPNVYIFNFL
ncbi:hypothetical protein X975_12452, partial [Stegodyphus mimosarum]